MGGSTALRLVEGGYSPSIELAGANDGGPSAAPGKCWYAAQEIADLKLPGLPRDKRKVNERARAEGWAFRIAADGSALARSRSGRGGGLEYHIDVLPGAARAALAPCAIAGTSISPARADVGGVWGWYDRQSEKVKAEAARRLVVVEHVARFEAAGMTRSAAVSAAAGQGGCSTATLWNWLRDCQGIPASDWLPHLAPKRQGGGKEAEIDPDLWQEFVSDYLRPERPTFESCFWRTKRIAEASGRTLPCSNTMRRKLERDIDPRLVIAKRDGMDALRMTLPYQRRTVEQLQAMELVNIDGHRWDVFVKMPDGRVMRPIMVAIQDVYSRKILSWRIGESESAVLTRLAFADLFRIHGIPGGCLLDNGRAFASKWITGGSASRFRFRIREEEPTGVLTALGVNIHWAKPYRGSSKPIERAFRDLCDAVAKHPAFAGAYTGNRPDAKPENYASKAVPLDLFNQVVATGIAAHNAKPGRRTETAQGRSFDAAYAESYATAPIGKATAEQLRLALLAADEVRTDRRSGEIELYGNRYWSEELSMIAGQRVTVRFDPDHLHGEVHVYARDGRFLTSAPVWEKTGFLDAAAAKRRAKQEGDLRKTIKRAAELEQLIDAEAIAAMLPSDDFGSDPPPVQVVRPVRHRGQTAAALKPASEPSQTPFIDRFAAAASRQLRIVE